MTDGLLVCAWGEGWMGLRLLLLCLKSSPLPQSVFLYFFLQACALIVRELHSQLALLYLKSKSGKSIKPQITLLWGDLWSLPWREVKGPQLSETYRMLHSCFVYLPGRHWIYLRMDEPVEPHKCMNMESATHWLKSRLCFTPWPTFPWLQHTRFK